MAGKGTQGLPAFTFPVVAWPPELATHRDDDGGTREFVSPRAVVTTYFPDSDLRLGWTFVDAEGRCWEAVTCQIAGVVGGWWVWMLPNWLFYRKYWLAIAFVERPPVSFDKVKSRLLAAVTANLRAYRGDATRRRRDIRTANDLRDLVKSNEQRAIERLQPSAQWWQWLFWEGRCSRLEFLAVVAALAGGWAATAQLRYAIPALAVILPVTVALASSALVRRMHDLKLSGWCLAPWFIFTWACGLVHDAFENPSLRTLFGWVWWTPTLICLLALAAWPGTSAPNRYGFRPHDRKNRHAG